MLHFEYGLQPYVRRVRVSDVASVPVEIFACFGGTVINTAVDGLRGHSSFKAKTNAFGTLFAFTSDRDQWHGHAVAVGSAATVITHSKVSDRGVDWHGNFPYATLLDASKGGLFGWGGAEKSLPNHMHDLTLWLECRRTLTLAPSSAPPPKVNPQPLDPPVTPEQELQPER